jgi:hypothetical protein
MGDFEQDMAQYESDWAGDMEKESAAQVLAQGTYQAKVAESRVEQTGWDDGWEFVLRFEDLNGAGQVTCWDSLETEIGRSIAASHSKALGYDGNLAGLKAFCEGGNFDDLVCEIRVKDNVKEEKTYKSVYVNRLFGKLDEEATVAAGASKGATDSDSDIPF